MTYLEQFDDSSILSLAGEELQKIIGLNDPNSAVVFYHVASYKIFEEFKEFLTEKDWSLLCKFILDNWENLYPNVRASLRKEDLEAEDCTLIQITDKFKPGVNYLPDIEAYIEVIDSSIEIKGYAESWGEVA